MAVLKKAAGFLGPPGTPSLFGERTRDGSLAVRFACVSRFHSSPDTYGMGLLVRKKSDCAGTLGLVSSRYFEGKIKCT